MYKTIFCHFQRDIYHSAELLLLYTLCNYVFIIKPIIRSKSNRSQQKKIKHNKIREKKKIVVQQLDTCHYFNLFNSNLNAQYLLNFL